MPKLTYKQQMNAFRRRRLQIMRLLKKHSKSEVARIMRISRQRIGQLANAESSK
ncbi:MAG: hypothetical protein ACYC36_03750 [Bellilinea sp.]